MFSIIEGAITHSQCKRKRHLLAGLTAAKRMSLETTTCIVGEGLHSWSSLKHVYIKPKRLILIAGCSQQLLIFDVFSILFAQLYAWHVMQTP